MTSIGKLRVTVQPFFYPEGGDELRVTVHLADGRAVTTTRALLMDDMTSAFDYYFDAAREALRAAIKEAA